MVVGAVSPTLVDTNMTLNTLRYIGAFKQGVRNRVKEVLNPKNPANWDNEKFSDWVHRTSKGRIDPLVLCPYETGRQMLRLPETEFLDRVMSAGKNVSEKWAKDF